MIHLDTGFLIRALVRNSSEDIKLRTWLRSNTPMAMSSIAWAEFLCGPVEKTDITVAGRIVPDRHPFNDEDASWQLGYSTVPAVGTERLSIV
jgi:predicted nucleic acid-binding protein